MTNTPALLATHLPLPDKRSGKVRDIYSLPQARSCESSSLAGITSGDDLIPGGLASGGGGGGGLLIVATDRISAFDVIMANGLPGKGIVLTQISRFWFDRFAHRVKHHLLSTDANDIPGLSPDQRASLQGRVMICEKSRVIPIECVVRGYLAGSGWKEYQQSQTVCGIKLPAGLKQCEKLPAPIFTPSTKAETGHDENISFSQSCQIAGPKLMTKLRDLSIALYSDARDYAAQRGIILADTKLEWGLPLDCTPGTADSESADPILIDEVLTPDSSRFWPADEYQPGRDQNSFDKQIVRNYLQGLCDAGQWNKTPPGPTLPHDITTRTMQRYLDAYQLLTGKSLPGV
ncbi:MAG: phosphoribosylaminoimidazolesuccinocarboxamide synthase [Phycisphaeraceae bacterium]